MSAHQSLPERPRRSSASLSMSPVKTYDRDNDRAKSSRAGGLSVADLLISAPADTTGAERLAKARPRSSSKSPGAEEIGEPTRPSSSRTSSSHTKPGFDATTMNEGVAAYQYTAMQQVTEKRERIEYKLTIREQPKHSRMCGVGEKADRRPIDPAPIIQLRVITHDHGPPSSLSRPGDADGDEVEALTYKSSPGGVVNASSTSSAEKVIRRGVPVQTSWGEGWEDKTWYLENPYYFMYAMLADAETDEELHLLHDCKTRYTTGSCVSCLYHLKDIDGSEQGFFVFPDLSIRVEGRYRLKLCLFETIGHEVHHCKSIYSTPFNVYTAKRFPGMEESTLLSKSFADQGLKVRVRKNPRVRRGRMGGKRKETMDSDEESDERPVSADVGLHAYEPLPSTAIKRAKSNGQDYARRMYDQQHMHSALDGRTEQLYLRHSPPRDPGHYLTQPAQPPFSRPPQHGGEGPAGERRVQQEMATSARYPVMAPRREPGYHTANLPDDRYGQPPPPRYSSGSHTVYQDRGPPLPPGVHVEQGESLRAMSYEQGHPGYHHGSNSREYGAARPTTSRDSGQYGHPLRSPEANKHAGGRQAKDEYGRPDARTVLPPLHLALSPAQSPRASSQQTYANRQGAGADSAAIPRHMPPPPPATSQPRRGNNRRP